MKWPQKTALILLFTIHHSSVCAQEYMISRESDGPFSFKLFGTVEMNEGSSLMRESILLNDPSCPVQITKNSISIAYLERRFAYEGSTGVSIEAAEVRAVEVRHALYNVFGLHMKNLRNTEARDLVSGEHMLKGTWRASDNDVTEFLTTATFVSRVRLSDGTQWVFDRDRLLLALGNLKLERKIGDEESSQ